MEVWVLFLLEIQLIKTFVYHGLMSYGVYARVCVCGCGDFKLPLTTIFWNQTHFGLPMSSWTAAFALFCLFCIPFSRQLYCQANSSNEGQSWSSSNLQMSKYSTDGLKKRLVCDSHTSLVRACLTFCSSSLRDSLILVLCIQYSFYFHINSCIPETIWQTLAVNWETLSARNHTPTTDTQTLHLTVKNRHA